jgi:hypothetical protein
MNYPPVLQTKALSIRTRKPFDPLKPVKLYTCTATHTRNTFYQKPSEGARSLEVHCQATLTGGIHENRQKLAGLAVEIFRRKANELYGINFSPGEVKVRFEAEEPALEASPDLTVDLLEMMYVGKEVRSRRFPTETVMLMTQVRSRQEFLVHRDDLVNAYARGYRDGSIAAGFPTKHDTARRYGRSFIDSLGQEEIWSWIERDAYDKGRRDAQDELSLDRSR